MDNDPLPFPNTLFAPLPPSLSCSLSLLLYHLPPSPPLFFLQFSLFAPPRSLSLGFLPTCLIFLFVLSLTLSYFIFHPHCFTFYCTLYQPSSPSPLTPTLYFFCNTLSSPSSSSLSLSLILSLLQHPPYCFPSATLSSVLPSLCFYPHSITVFSATLTLPSLSLSHIHLTIATDLTLSFSLSSSFLLFLSSPQIKHGW